MEKEKISLGQLSPEENERLIDELESEMRKSGAVLTRADISAIDTIEIDGTTLVNAKAIYDINGRDVTNANGHLRPGVYIARTATSTIKLVVK